MRRSTRDAPGPGADGIDGSGTRRRPGEPVEEADIGARTGAARTTHRHGDLEHASDHAHPHAHSGPGDRPVVGIVGAGAVGTALGVALSPRGLAGRRGRLA